ncbi:uncharacterized protein LOC121420273 [Lytechinus variegatus]|uniref:uncharacterized protein LOC121420273 n=1 Tax=Lytechinus variegatus TaxID=7654 RepID=UPI001BB25EE4|nr:uncharacterized protein LOC121420273 [Lytechinus variegatus]
MSALFNNEKNKSDNPFYDAPEPRAFYHPTLTKHLTKKTRAISLSPERVKSHLKSSDDVQHRRVKELSPGEKGFLSGSNTMLAKELPTHDTPSPGPADTSSKFDESWPASERPSTIESPADAQNVSSSSAATSHAPVSGVSLSPHDVIGTQEHISTHESDSTLARFIDRFRYGAPKSREERARLSATGSKDFWWLSSSSSSPPLPSQQPSSSSMSSQAPTKTTPIRGTRLSRGVKGLEGSHRGGAGGGRGVSRIPSWSGVSKSGVSSLSSGRRVSGVSTLSSSSSSSMKMPSPVTDKETDEIQRRAEKLLELSDRTILSEPPVSSDGIGSFSTSSPITDDTPPSRDSDVYSSRYRDKENIPRPPLFPANLNYTQRPQRPEEDILQQWRMRRRMEQAKEGALHRVLGQMSERPLRPTQVDNVRKRDITEGGSRLENFRRRLQQQKLLTEARVASNIQQGPTKAATTTHSGTDPIPQSIATQTGRAGSSCIQTGSGSHLYDQASHLQQERTLRSDTLRVGEEECHQPYPVASPNVQAAESRWGHDPMSVPNVVPHLHMSCDILPCGERGPHVHTERDVKDRVDNVGHGRSDLAHTESQHKHPYGHDHYRRVARNNASIDLPHKQATFPNEKDQRILHLPQNTHHQERRPPNWSETWTDEDECSLHSSGGHDRTSHYDGPSKGPRNSSSDYIQEMASGESPHDPSRLLDAGQQSAVDDTRTVDHHQALPSGTRTPADSCSTVKSAQDEALTIDTRQPSASEVTRSSDQTSGTRTRTLQGVQEDTIHDTSSGEMQERHITKQQQRPDDGEDADGAKRQLQFGSSSPINSAIGQVISDRIFSSPKGQRSTPSSIRSPALSQDTLMFTPPVESKASSQERISKGILPEPPDPEPPESVGSSDSEDFKDDEMLQVLRKQREECIRKLNHLDSLLSHTSI